MLAKVGRQKGLRQAFSDHEGEKWGNVVLYQSLLLFIFFFFVSKYLLTFFFF
ncbi:hypothetical protein HanIR_Chr09g0392551 [Helianthus annuus]|nr:hypothetical protein HanIR_Chr09g0392551 [Helianthus annuus]